VITLPAARARRLAALHRFAVDLHIFPALRRIDRLKTHLVEHKTPHNQSKWVPIFSVLDNTHNGSSTSIKHRT
jgi:hypothetical protein